MNHQPSKNFYSVGIQDFQMNLKGSKRGSAAPLIKETKKDLHVKPRGSLTQFYNQEEESIPPFEWNEGGKLVPPFLSHLTLF